MYICKMYDLQPTLVLCTFISYLRLYLPTVCRVHFRPMYWSRKEKTVCIMCLSVNNDVSNLSSGCSGVILLKLTRLEQHKYINTILGLLCMWIDY